MEQIVFLNGKFLPIREARACVLTPGILSGLGLFETIRSYNKKIIYLKEHLRRIKKSCHLIGIDFPYTLDKLKKLIEKTVAVNGLPDVYVRLTLWKAEEKTDTLIIVKRYQAYSRQKYRKGFSAMISRFRQNEPFLAQMKTTSRLLYELGLEEAKKKGFDEAIILTSRGYITEGSHSNLFFIKDDEIFTPALECSCLDGITRRVIFDLTKKCNLKIYEGNFTVQDLSKADEAFLTNSLMGVMPLRRLQEKQIGKGPNKLTRFFMQKYNQLLYGTKKDKITL